MNTKEKLTPEQQAERTRGLYKNLERQAHKIFKHDRSGSIDTRKPYFAAEKRFCRFLAENYSLQNLKNVEPRHFYAFAEDMKAKGLSTSYIYATLSAIRYYNDKLGGKNEMPKDNKELHLEKRHPGALNRAWMDSEIEKACRVAYEMKGGGDHLDIIAAFRLGQRFGLRVNESVQVKVGDLEYALRTRQFHVPRGKCGQRRDIPVTTKEQITLLEKLIAYAKKKGKESGDYLLCDNHDNSVFEEKKRIERWISNHKHKFQDPDRASKVEPGKKPRATKRLGFHSLRHTYTQKSMKTMREQGLPEKKVQKEASESLGHHRTSITKIYEE